MGQLGRTTLGAFARIAFLFLILSPGLALAQATTFLSGTVTFDGRPVVGADVSAAGANLNLHTSTDAKGRFTFAAVPFGTYNVDVKASSGQSSLRLDVSTAGADITLALDPIKQIGRTSVTARPPVHGSGTDVNLSTSQ